MLRRSSEREIAALEMGCDNDAVPGAVEDLVRSRSLQKQALLAALMLAKAQGGYVAGMLSKRMARLHPDPSLRFLEVHRAQPRATRVPAALLPALRPLVFKATLLSLRHDLSP